MFAVSRICILLFLLSIPTAIGFALTRLLVRRRGEPGTVPFRNRLYSGLKRMSCVWGVEIAVCVLAFVVLGCWDLGFMPNSVHFVCFVGLALLAFALGIFFPRAYMDGIDRVKSGRRLAWGLLAFYLFVVMFVAFIAVNVMAGVGFGGHKNPREFVIESPSYETSKFRVAGSVATKMIPPGATDIKFSYRPGLGGALGAFAELRCHVEKDVLLSFAKERGYAFRSDSYTFNVCADGPKDCDFIHAVWEKYNPSREKVYRDPKDSSHMAVFKVAPDWVPSFSVGAKPYPKDFLAYNNRRSSCGGYSFFYDVKAKILYADWSSN